jgi:rhodanese-related sulfurtransferase
MASRSGGLWPARELAERAKRQTEETAAEDRAVQRQAQYAQLIASGRRSRTVAEVLAEAAL